MVHWIKKKKKRLGWGYSIVIPLDHTRSTNEKLLLFTEPFMCECYSAVLWIVLHVSFVTMLWWPHDNPTLRIRKWSLGEALKQVSGSMEETHCLPPKPQALGHCALHLEIVMTAPNNPNHVVPFPSQCMPGSPPLDLHGLELITRAFKVQCSHSSREYVKKAGKGKTLEEPRCTTFLMDRIEETVNAHWWELGSV